MWFGRSKKRSDDDYPHEGRPAATDGYTAAFEVELLTPDAAVVQSTGDVGSVTTGSHDAVRRYDADSPGAAVARASGLAATGVRAAAVLDGVGDAGDSLRAAAGRRLPIVVHVACRAPQRHAGALRGSHDAYYDLGGTGVLQMFARNAQDVADLSVIARRVAEQTLTPTVCAQELYRTTHSVANVMLPERELIEAFLGEAGDKIDTPFPSQRMLFGESRRRVPRMVDVDHPAGVGGVQDAESHAGAVFAQRAFFAAHAADAIRDAMESFAELTGRRYAPIDAYRTDDAEFVILSQGAIADDLRAAIDYARDHDGIKVGAADLLVYRPFPAADCARILEGRRVVTVLERADQPLAGDLPLTREVRAAIDRAVENGADRKPADALYPAFAADKRPRVQTGVYGVGGALPTFAELVAVARNAAASDARTSFTVGPDVEQSMRRFPHLEAVQQLLARDYPDLAATTLSAAPDVNPPAGGDSVELHTLSLQEGVFAGNTFARAVAESLNRAVRTFPEGGTDSSLQPSVFRMAHADADAIVCPPESVDVLLVSGASLLEVASSDATLREGGRIIVESNRDDDALWVGLSRRTARWIRDRGAAAFALDARRIAAESASKPSFVDQLAVWALLGAYARIALPDDVETIAGAVEQRLRALAGPRSRFVDDVAGAFRRGAEGVRELAWAERSIDELPSVPESEAPWTVKGMERGANDVFDVTRFWHSVGYLYQSGQEDRAIVDPYVGTGVVPARSSAFRDMTPFRLGVPEWLPENCTGCGVCWAVCPDSALPPAVHSVGGIVDYAMSAAEAAGVALIQMKRVATHLTKQAYLLVSRDGLSAHRNAGALLDASFSQLVDKMDLDEEKLAALRDEFGHVRARVEDYPISRTQRFFEDAHDAEKGSGALLSIALNPLSCTGCGICVQACPEDAFDWVEQTPDRVERARAAWNAQLSMPQELAVPEGAGSHEDAVFRMLDGETYHTMVGGDDAAPGSGAKIAVHLTTAAVESEMGRRYRARIERIDGLVGRLESAIQGDVSGMLRINDFDEFSRRLGRIDDERVTPVDLASIAGGEENGLDPAHLRRLTGLLGSLREQRRLYTEGANGRGRARMTLVIDSESVRLWSGRYPFNPHTQPWIFLRPGDGPELALGAHAGITSAMLAETRVVRAAELELDGAYHPSKHDAELAALTESDLTDDERDLLPPIVLVTDARSADWDAIRALLDGDAHVIVAAVDPEGATVSDEAVEADRVLSMGLSATRAAVAQCSVGVPGHLIDCAARAAAHGAPALIHIHAPDPRTCGIAPAEVVAQAELAVRSRAFPLFRVVRREGAVTVDLTGNPDPDARWSARELAFSEPSGGESRGTYPATLADWAAGEARFQRHFDVVPKGEADSATPLVDYIDMADEQRESTRPAIHIADASRKHFIAIVSRDMAGATERHVAFWDRLRALSESPRPDAPAPSVDAPTPSSEAPSEQPAVAAAMTDASVHELVTERLLQLCGYSDDPTFFEKSLRDFVVQRNQETQDE